MVDLDVPLDLIQRRCKGVFSQQLHVLEEIAAGTLTNQSVQVYPAQYNDEGKEITPQRRVTTVTKPTFRDRLTALDMLRQYGQVPTTAEAQRGRGGFGAGDLLKTLVQALADPTIRRWLMEPEQAEGFALLQAVAAQGALPAPAVRGESDASDVPAVDYEVVTPGD